MDRPAEGSRTGQSTPDGNWVIVPRVRLFLAFTLIPLAEMYLLIRIGAEIGALNTIALVVVTAFVGASLTRLEGWRTLQRIQETMHQGMVPAEEMIDGMLIFAAGLVLITPGLLTDALGFALLIPGTRRVIKRWLRRRFDDMVGRGDVRVVAADPTLGCSAVLTV